MTVARGYKAAATVDFESAYNTAPITKKGYILPIIKNEIEHKQTQITSDTITGTRNDVMSALGRISEEGTVTVPADYRAIGYWLRAQFGAPTTTGTAAPYSHAFKVVDDQPSLIIDKAFPDIGQYLRYHGCKINTAKWSFGDDKEMTVELAIVGALRETATAAYNASATTIAANPISQNHTYVKIGGTASAIISSGDFTFDSQLDTSKGYTVGANGIRTALPEGIMKASGNIEALFTDTSFLTLADTNAKTSLEIGFSLNASTSLAFLFPEVQLEPHDVPIDGPGGVSAKFAWKAFYQSDSGKSLVQITLKNDVGAYV
jgi:hypothetical protein